MKLLKFKKSSRKKQGLHQKLKDLLKMDILYTIDDLVYLTGYKENYVRSAISMIQNQKYMNPPVEIIWKKCEDQVKRLGNPTATNIYQSLKND